MGRQTKQPAGIEVLKALNVVVVVVVVAVGGHHHFEIKALGI